MTVATRSGSIHCGVTRANRQGPVLTQPIALSGTGQVMTGFWANTGVSDQRKKVHVIFTKKMVVMNVWKSVLV